MREYIIVLKSHDTGRWIAYGYEGAQPFPTYEEADKTRQEVIDTDKRRTEAYRRPLTWTDSLVALLK